MKKTRYSIALIALLSTANATEAKLDDVTVVSTNKTTQSIKNTTANITIITQSDIEKHGYSSVSDALSSAVGMSVSQAGGTGQKSSFFMRGMDSGKILVLVDGMRINDPSTTNNTAMLEFVPIANVEQIEILRGGASSIWGANASAGVINIITKNSKKDGTNGSVGLSYGSHDTKAGDLSLFNKSGKLSTKLLVSKSSTDSISALATTDKSKGEADRFDMANVVAGVGYDFTDDTKLSLTLNKTNTDGDYDQSFSGGANDKKSNFKSKSTSYAGSFSTKIAGVDSTFNVSRGEYGRKYDNGISVYNATTDEYSLINSYKYSMGKSVLGFEYKDIDGFNQYGTYAPTDGGFKNRAIFLANTLSPIDSLLLEGNIRYDDFDKFNSTTSYKLGAKYDLIKNIKVGANYYKSLNAPSVYQLANTVYGESLKPSLVNGYDFSIGYDKYITATYFDNKIKDDIAYDNANWGYYNNTATENIRGIEVSAKTPSLLDMFVVRANYTHLIDMKDKSGATLLNRARDEFNGFIDYMPNDTLGFTLDAHYVGDKYSPFGYPIKPIASGNYTTLGLHATIEFSNNLSLALHLNNMFDKDYQSIYGYNSDGRNANFKVNYKF